MLDIMRWITANRSRCRSTHQTLVITMNFIFKLTSAIAAAVLAGAALAQAPHPAGDAPLPPEIVAAMQTIEAPRIAAHVKFLADDLLEGRGTGTRGGDIAAQYIATQFALAGLKPAGDNGSYLQKVRFLGTHTEAESTFALLPATGGPIPLRLADDIVSGNETGAESADIEAPIVFVGHGIEAPEYQWDDYKGVDVKGKVVLIVVNEPASDDVAFFNGPALTYYGRWTYKFEQAARKGAVGALIIHKTELASYPWDVVRSSWSGEQVYLADDKRPKLQAASWIQLDVARVLLAASGRNLDEMLKLVDTRDFKAFELPVNFKAHIVSKVRHFESSNVIGMLPGSDKAAPNAALKPAVTQVVFYTAHYDHLGIDPDLPGPDNTDRIYNGAVDNGTGCGILLELARAWASSKLAPPHPMYFASVTAEEKGLLGSKYLGDHLPVPASAVAIDLNYDAVPPIGDPESIEVSGAERTSFYPTVEKIAKRMNLAIEPDATPSAGHYYRSDHFSFARVGVPAFSINTGLKFAGHTADWGAAQQKDYTANRYHRPGDEWTPEQDYRSNAKLAQLGFALGWEASSAADTVGWQPGDEFAALRARSEKTP
jgi:Zn-dependent M28 family amino/carboxypeptidase